MPTRPSLTTAPQNAPLYAPPFCDFVLLAEFDIDRGSVVRRQFPDVTGIGENTLAEAMLPEGAHLRETGSFSASYIHSSVFLAPSNRNPASVSSGDAQSDWTVFRVTDQARIEGLGKLIKQVRVIAEVPLS
jgi:hypothetical protein